MTDKYIRNTKIYDHQPALIIRCIKPIYMTCEHISASLGITNIFWFLLLGVSIFCFCSQSSDNTELTCL